MAERLAAQRRDIILRLVRLRGAVRVDEIAERFSVSVATARRDLTVLVGEGLLVRVHGGAALASSAQGPGRHKLTGVSGVVGMVVPASDYYYAPVIRGAEIAAARLGVRLVLAVSNYSQEDELQQFKRLVELGAEAILFSTSVAAGPLDPSPDVPDLGVPVVLVERHLEAGSEREFVRTDHAAGALIALQHLACLGHRRAALSVKRGSPPTPWLLEGYERAVATGVVEHGMAPVIVPRIESHPDQNARALRALLDTCLRTDTRAVVVHNDGDAMLLARIAAENGLTVPEDLSIIAYDDEIAGLGEPKLTAIAPAKEEIGSSAIEAAVRRLSQGPDAVKQRLSLVPRLVVRESSGPPPRT
jgi:DNA-binding LacI/PurR family transcriptional regulator